MRLNIHFSAAFVVCLPLLYASSPANADSVSAEIQAGVRNLMETRQKLLDQLPDSLLAKQIADILSKAGAELTAYEEQLRPQNLPRNERIDKLRKRFRELMNPLYELEPRSGGFDMLYDESDFMLQIRRFDTAGGSDHFETYYLGGGLARLFNMLSFFSEAVRTDPDTFSRAFKMALKNFMMEAQDIVKGHEGTKLESELLKRFSEIRADLTRLDEELRQQNAPHDKRIKTLRERYLEWMKRFKHFGPVYDGDSEYDIGGRPPSQGSTIRVSKLTVVGSVVTGPFVTEGFIGRTLEKTLLVRVSLERERLTYLTYALIAVAASAAAALALLLFFKAAKRKRAKSS